MKSALLWNDSVSRALGIDNQVSDSGIDLPQIKEATPGGLNYLTCILPEFQLQVLLTS